MVQMSVGSPMDLQESVQGRPVNQSQNSETQNQKSNEKKGKDVVISSTDLPSQTGTKKADGASGQTPAKKPRKVWLWIIILLFILGGAAAAYFLLLKDKIFGAA